MEKILIANIIVGSRYRKDFGDIEELAASLNKLGQIQPIVLDRNNNLIAGERRLRASQHNGWDEIGFVYNDALSDIDKKEIEIEENLKRKEFNWPEEVLALDDLYQLKRAKYGPRTQGSRDGLGFGMQDAAELFDKSIGSIHMDLELAKAVREFKEIAFEKTKHAAFKKYKRLKDKSLREEIAKRQNVADDVLNVFDQKPKAPEERQGAYPTESQVRSAKFVGYGTLYNGDCQMVTRYLPTSILDVLVTDPPYGLGLFKEGDDTSGKRLAEHEGGLYDDDPFRVMDMLSKVFTTCNRILKPDGHAYIFFHSTWYEQMYDMLCQAFGKTYVDPTPLVWCKNTSGIGNPNERWVYAYEPCFFINKGRPLIQPQAFNYLKYDTVPPNKKTHPTEKPTAMLRHMIQASAVAGETVGDFFAGSGSTLVAAVESGCRFIGCELDATYYLRIADRLATSIGAIDKEGVEVQNTEAAPEVQDAAGV